VSKIPKRFKIRYKTSKYYYNVFVFDTIQQMYRYGKKNLELGVSDYDALVYSVLKHTRRGGIHPNFGVVLFHHGSLRLELIAHEMLHCALHHDRILGGMEYWQIDDEERLAYRLTGYMDTCIKNLQKLGYLI
jgi:hypothetical protein